MSITPFGGLISAVFTPMYPDGTLNLSLVQPIVEHLYNEGVNGLYVCGSTGEGPSLSTEERCMVAEAYVSAAKDKFPVIVQVGHNSLTEARKLAVHAESIGADAISAVPPDYFKVGSLDTLMDCLVEINQAVKEIPFFYYHIPALSGVQFDMVEFLRRGEKQIPNLAGIKYSATTVYEMQACIEYGNGRYTVFFGCDEMLLSGLCAGAAGAVGSTYNFAAPLYRKIIHAYQNGDMQSAKQYQSKSANMVRTIARYHGAAGIKATMGLIGHDCGPCRLPWVNLSDDELAAMKTELEQINFFAWARV